MADNLRVFIHGSHFENYLIQLLSVILGAIIKCGPYMFLYYLRKAKIDIDCMVLPRPISSAKMPLIPL